MSKLTVWERLDVIDKKLSRPLFLAKLPLRFQELLLSIPGNFFGSGSFALITCPAITTIIFLYNSNNKEDTSFQQWYGWMVGVALLFCINLIIWVQILSSKNRKLHQQAINLFYGKLLGAIGPILSIGILSLTPNHTEQERYARQMGYAQICMWSIGVVPIAILKPWVARQRPAYWIHQSQEHVRLQQAAATKHFPILPKMFVHDPNASFPSGDAGGAIGCMFPLLFLQQEAEKSVSTIYLAWTFVLLSCIGRVYFFAHHVGDVMAGVTTSLAACWIFQQLVCDSKGNNSITWWTPLVSHAFLLAIVLFTRWLHKHGILDAGTITIQVHK